MLEECAMNIVQDKHISPCCSFYSPATRGQDIISPQSQLMCILGDLQVIHQASKHSVKSGKSKFLHVPIDHKQQSTNKRTIQVGKVPVIASSFGPRNTYSSEKLLYDVELR